LLVTSRQGNQKHYQANHASPIFNELIGIVKKTFGVKEVMQAALGELLSYLNHAFIYGSIAKGGDHAASDVDVMLVGEELSYSRVMQLLESAEIQLQRTINPTIYSQQEFTERLADDTSFVSKVMAQARINLLDQSGTIENEGTG
jgi:predicted nucleotidyltransferase